MNRVGILSLPCQGASQPFPGCLGESLGHFDFLWTPRWVFCGLIRRVCRCGLTTKTMVWCALSSQWLSWVEEEVLPSFWGLHVCSKDSNKEGDEDGACMFGTEWQHEGTLNGWLWIFLLRKDWACWVTWANEEPCGPANLFALAIMLPAFASRSLGPSRK